MKSENSTPASFEFSGDASVRDVAGRWIIRKDRGMTDAEAAELDAWLSADAHHAAAFAQSAASWQRFREIGAASRRAPVKAKPERFSYMPWVAMGSLAALITLTFVLGFRPATGDGASDAMAAQRTAAVPVMPATRHLADGSIVRLRDGAAIAESFTATERRVRLVSGEVFFEVTKDNERPFLVVVGGVTVRAVGTAFSVRFLPQAVDILVAEGAVQVTSPSKPVRPDLTLQTDISALVNAGHRAIVDLSKGPEMQALSLIRVQPEEITRELVWSRPMLDLGEATLAEWVTAFAEHSRHRIEIVDSALSSVRIGGRFPADDVDGFIHALEQIYDVATEKRVDGTIELRLGRQP
jgi:transmembrane sensor